MPKLLDEVDEYRKLFDDPSNRDKKTKEVVKTKHHIINQLSKYSVLGIEEAVLSKNDFYFTGIQVLSLKADLYRIDKDAFCKTVIQQATVWDAIIDKSTHNFKTYDRSIRKMQASNIKIIDTMNKDSEDIKSEEIIEVNRL